MNCLTSYSKNSDLTETGGWKTHVKIKDEEGRKSKTDSGLGNTKKLNMNH